jgi:phenylacetic acid degradation operon negative regulatory protein
MTVSTKRGFMARYYHNAVTIVKTLKNTELATTLDLSNPASPSKSLINDIAIRFLYDQENWLPTATWVALLGDLGISKASARQALDRMHRSDFLVREQRDRRVGYGMARAWFDYIDRFIETRESESDQRLGLVVFSVPEKERSRRHALRTVLERYGLASLGYGTWIGSALRVRYARITLETSGLIAYVNTFHADYDGDALDLVRRCWDIDALAAMYHELIAELRARLTLTPRADAKTFAGLVLSSNAYRRATYADPGLPTSVLPANWPSRDAYRLFSDLQDRFLEPARDYARSVTARA